MEEFKEKNVNHYELLISEKEERGDISLFEDEDLFSSLPPILQSKFKLEKNAKTRSARILKKLFKYENPKSKYPQFALKCYAEKFTAENRNKWGGGSQTQRKTENSYMTK